MNDAQDFVDHGYAQQRDAAKNKIDELNSKLAQLHKQEANLEGQLSDLRNRAAGLPDTVQETVEKEVCKWIEQVVGVFKKVCDIVPEITTVVNKQKQDLLGEITSKEKQLEDLRKGAISSAEGELTAATQTIVDLDSRLQAFRTELQKKTLQLAVAVARTELQNSAKALREARKRTYEARRALDRVKGDLAVWRNDRPALDALASAEPPQSQEPEPPPIAEGRLGTPPRENGEEVPRLPNKPAGVLQLRSQLVQVKQTLERPPLLQVVRDSLWYVYQGEIGGVNRCWLLGTLLTQPGGVARAARIFVAPYTSRGPLLVMAAHLVDPWGGAKVATTPRPILDIDGTRFPMTISNDRKYMFIENGEDESKAISLMKAKQNVTLVCVMGGWTNS